MLARLLRHGFFRPAERLYELITLQQAERAEGLLLEYGSDALMDARTIGGYVADLEAKQFLARTKTSDGTSPCFRLTEKGHQRLRFLAVDLTREIDALERTARNFLRQRFVNLALNGMQRVAFYPFGETAEAAYLAMEGLDLTLAAIADDMPEKQGLRFHGLRVVEPRTLREVAPDIIIVTTTVFEAQIIARLGELGLDDIPIQVF